MPEEINRGLGSVGAPAEQQQAQGNEQSVAVPNSSLAMLNEKRVADNVVQERNTGITLGKIKDEAKAEIMQNMANAQIANQQRQMELGIAAEDGYKTGLYDASALQQAAMQSQPDTSYAQNYSEPVVGEQSNSQSNGLGRLY